MEALNKKAYFNYFVEDEIEAGISLLGTEIKSFRVHSCNITDSYIRIKNNEAFVINMNIPKYEGADQFNHDETRERKLLLHKKEILKLSNKIDTEGYTLIPLKVYLKNNKCKVLMGLCKGKKLYDKRESIKKRDIERSSYQKIS